MHRTFRFALVCLLMLPALRCAGQRRESVLVPPRIDLSQHELIGVIDFRSPSDAQLGTFATERFTTSARRDQGPVRMVAFGPRQALDTETLQALGRERGVQTILTGELTISRTKPGVRIDSGFRSGSVSALVEATLAVRLVEVSTGASLWSSSARASQSVGGVQVLGGKDVTFGADDPQSVYGDLVENLVQQTTTDFHAHWEQR